VAGLFLVLEAEFLAFVQILIYVGAILTLVVFAIMLTAKLDAGTAVSASRQTLPAAAASLGLFVALVTATRPLLHVPRALGDPVPIAALGHQLVTTLVLPFEVISLVCVATLIGAITVAVPKPPPTSTP
jgi:NADH-quinone oxidoreductase subunit J/NAD(P)H-quinone oxidoreductase subunit 6